MGERRQVVLGAWIGSPNLGDELLARAVLRRLDRLDADVTVVSADPDATRRVHGVAAIGPRDVRALRHALATADLFLLGPGGLLQDETSWFSLPRHLHRVVLARRAGVPVAAIGLGAGPLDTRLGRWQVGRALRDVSSVVVRDAQSAALLESCGLVGVEVAADWALSLDPPEVAPADRVVACLRPFSGKGRLLPSRWRDRHDPRGEARVRGLAHALDRLADDTGLPVHLVAFERGRDDRFHERIAATMRTPATLATPGLDDVLGEVASARLVVAMRYHAGIAALLGGRPAVLVGYAPKVVALAGDAAEAVVLVEDSQAGYERIPAAARDIADRADEAVVVRERLRVHEQRNDELLSRVFRGLDASERG